MAYYNWFVILNVIHDVVESSVVGNQVSRIHNHPRVSPHSCLTDSAVSGVTRSIQLEWARSVPDIIDVRDSMT